MTDGSASPMLSLNAYFCGSGSSITPENQCIPLSTRIPWANHAAGGRHLDGTAPFGSGALGNTRAEAAHAVGISPSRIPITREKAV